MKTLVCVMYVLYFISRVLKTIFKENKISFIYQWLLLLLIYFRWTSDILFNKVYLAFFVKIS